MQICFCLHGFMCKEIAEFKTKIKKPVMCTKTYTLLGCFDLLINNTNVFVKVSRVCEPLCKVQTRGHHRDGSLPQGGHDLNQI